MRTSSRRSRRPCQGDGHGADEAERDQRSPDPHEVDDDRSEGGAGRDAERLIPSKPGEHARASRFVGEAGAGSVNPPTSTSALPIPTTASSAIAAASCGTAPIAGDRQAPERNADSQPDREPPGPNEQQARHEPRSAPAPTAPFKMPAPGGPVSSRRMATMTDMTLSAAAGERLRGRQLR